MHADCWAGPGVPASCATEAPLLQSGAPLKRSRSHPCGVRSGLGGADQCARNRAGEARAKHCGTSRRQRCPPARCWDGGRGTGRLRWASAVRPASPSLRRGRCWSGRPGPACWARCRRSPPHSSPASLWPPAWPRPRRRQQAPWCRPRCSRAPRLPRYPRAWSGRPLSCRASRWRLPGRPALLPPSEAAQGRALLALAGMAARSVRLAISGGLTVPGRTCSKSQPRAGCRHLAGCRRARRCPR
mmetsp:Transcript_99098/g.289119  ORF Transcript_99098/g.289119 Transcript_99098/m.289119 type:complete len:243 (-) Transcript_99098:1793-2521(-)